MQGSIRPITAKRLEYVGSFRIYVTAEGELVIPIGNCRVCVEEEQAREFLDDLLSLAGRFRQLLSNGNGHTVAQS